MTKKKIVKEVKVEDIQETINKAVKEAEAKSSTIEPNTMDLVEMDNKIWTHIDDLKAKVFKLTRLVHRVADRLGIDEK